MTLPRQLITNTLSNVMSINNYEEYWFQNTETTSFFSHNNNVREQQFTKVYPGSARDPPFIVSAKRSENLLFLHINVCISQVFQKSLSSTEAIPQWGWATANFAGRLLGGGNLMWSDFDYLNLLKS